MFNSGLSQAGLIPVRYIAARGRCLDTVGEELGICVPQGQAAAAVGTSVGGRGASDGVPTKHTAVDLESSLLPSFP